MKFVGFLVVTFASGVPLFIGCGSAENSNFFSESAGGRDLGSAGTDLASAGLSEGGKTSAEGGAPGDIAGRPNMSTAGKNGAAGDASSAAGSSSGGSLGSAAGTSGAGAGSAGKGSAGGAGSSAGASGSVSAAGSGGVAGGGAGSGGNTSGSGGMSGNNGSSGSSGMNGGSGAAGSGGASACPASPPPKNEVCDVITPNSCFYAGQACSCLASTGGIGPINPTKKWACYGDGAMCPDAKPVAGTSCKPTLGLECPYPGNDFCVCSSNGIDSRWVCQASSATCALIKPLDNSCSTVRTCSWGLNKDVACFCNGTRWDCTGGF